MKHINEFFHIKPKLTSPKNSKSNGIAEKTVKCIKDALQIYCRTGNLDKWVEFLPMIAMSFKAMSSLVNGFSPFELIHGIKMNTALDQSLANISAQLPLDVQTYLKNLKQRLVIIRDHAIAQSKAAKESQKLQYDKSHKTKPLQLAIGQQVLLHQPVCQPEKPRKCHE